MRQLRLLFLALFFVLSTSASAAASVHKCCADQGCDLMLCIAISCAPAIPPAAFDKSIVVAPKRVREVYATLASPRTPHLYEEVWTPPD